MRCFTVSLIIFLGANLISNSQALAEESLRNTKLIIVANVDSEISLSKQEVKNLFMGGVIDYDLRPISLSAENKERTLFHTRILGLTDARVRSYWAQMRFSGRKQQPENAANEAQALKYVLANPGTVTYIKSTTPLPKDLVVVYQSN